jgi:hypothetical protein
MSTENSTLRHYKGKEDTTDREVEAGPPTSAAQDKTPITNEEAQPGAVSTRPNRAIKTTTRLGKFVSDSRVDGPRWHRKPLNVRKS